MSSEGFAVSRKRFSLPIGRRKKTKPVSDRFCKSITRLVSNSKPSCRKLLTAARLQIKSQCTLAINRRRCRLSSIHTPQSLLPVCYGTHSICASTILFPITHICTLHLLFLSRIQPCMGTSKHILLLQISIAKFP